MDKNIDLTGIDKEIDEILRAYIAVNSETGTLGEKGAESFLLNYLGDIPYFKEHPEQFGAISVTGDLLNRAVCWALVKGEGSDTAILIHHYDVVGVEDFKTLKDVAFQPDMLAQELRRFADDLSPEARTDLLSGDYLFGRGAADMKGGGAIQLALLKRYSHYTGWKGNLLLLALPDEENLSAGMRAAVDLMDGLKRTFGLDYRYVFNSEPHQRKREDRGLLSEGSVGKMLSFVYARGFLAHVGKVFEGLNPVAVLSEIVTQTELSPIFSDLVGGEAAPPPTWLYFRDRKENYDVSMPLGAGGCVSILTLNSNPIEVLKLLKQVALDSFEVVTERMNEKYKIFCKNTGQDIRQLPWKPLVMTFSDLLEEAQRNHGEEFSAAYEKEMKAIGERIKTGELDLMESSFVLTEFVYNFISDLSPRVILGFVPPFYPNVSNLLLENLPETESFLADEISKYSMELFGHGYDREYYYTGISDLSYFAIKDSGGIQEELERDMPLYGTIYSIPLKKIEPMSMPGMNIGPWGKDFHKLTERVYKPDLYQRTPALLHYAIQKILGHDGKKE